MGGTTALKARKEEKQVVKINPLSAVYRIALPAVPLLRLLSGVNGLRCETSSLLAKSYLVTETQSVDGKKKKMK